MQNKQINKLGSWLGLFAMAMLFIGPLVGQWRASLAAEPAASEHAEHAPQLNPHSQHGQNSHPQAHAEHVGHVASTAKSQVSHSADGYRIGALELNHCGYCHLQASFAALPATEWPNVLPFWAAVEQAAWVYQAPRTAWRSSAFARAPPIA